MDAYEYYPFSGITRGISDNTGTDENLYYFGARYYNADLGIWHSVDPLAEKYPGWSAYNYCLNSPICSLDKSGRAPNPFYLSHAIMTTVSTMNAEQKTFRKATEALQKSGKFPAGGNGAADAWRHVATSKYFAEKYGATVAKVLGIANEMKAVVKMIGADKEVQEQHLKEIKMDLKNNKTGRELAGQDVDLIQKANDGEFTTLTEEDKELEENRDEEQADRVREKQEEDEEREEAERR